MAEETLLQPGLTIKPQVTHLDICEILKNVYNITSCTAIKQLNGYDDCNFLLEIGANTHYVFKVINVLDSKKPQLFEAQTKILLHLNQHNVCCPKPIATKTGEYFTIQSFCSGDHIVRILEFIPGDILYHQPSSPNLFYDVGKYVARIDLALANFSHPVYETHRTIWMLDSVPQLAQFTYVLDSKRRQLVEQIVEEFKSTVLPIRDKLPQGMIHGDFNEQNIIVESGRVKAVLDFGDAQFACYIYEVAIAMAYMMLQAKSLQAGGWVLQGYCSVRPLAQPELSLLKVCIAARLCQSLVIGAYTSQQDPDNAYVLTTSKPGWIMVEELWAEPARRLLDQYWAKDL